MEIVNVYSEGASNWMPVKYIQSKTENPSQWNVMKNAVDGAIHHIEVLSGETVSDGEVTLIKEDNSTWPVFDATCTSNKITVTTTVH